MLDGASRSFATLLVLAAGADPAAGQGVLDVLDGETLYDGGSLVSLGFELDRGEVLRRGTRRAPDPLARQQTAMRTTLAYQYGARHDLQLGVALSVVDLERRGAGLRQSADGLGDVELLTKWRFYRWDAHAVALNVALVAQVSVPTGKDDVRDSTGTRLEPELQPGSGGIDPALGIAATHEPGRWRFNLATWYRVHTDSDDDGFRRGDRWIVEAAAGNRFWLEPYPGPFMRLDVALRYYHEDHDRFRGALPNTGGERATTTVNLAFRPQPALDFQVAVEVPLWQRLAGTQLGEDWALDLTFGYRF